MVISDTGVEGRYNELDAAKQVLKGITDGNRLIAEVDSTGNLIRDPHIISGQSQDAGNGFNHSWCSWTCINSLMDMGQAYLN